MKKGSTSSKLGKYAFFLGSAAMLVRADGAAIAQFTFESLATTGSTGANFGPYLADFGIGTAVSVHAASTTVYSSPAGSGSQRSLSANSYVSGDYFQFTIDATGFTDLVVAFDAVSSGTGPKVFSLQYAVSGSTAPFAAFSSYTLNTGTTTAFATAATNSAVNYSFNLSSVSALNGTTGIFRLVDTDTTTASGGTSRVDNFFVSGTAVPEPSAVALLTAAGAAMMATRRRQRA